MDLLKEAARKRPRVLDRLLKAKAESDRHNWPAKHSILRDLIREDPASWAVDSSRHGVVGLTHRPTNFRIHMPKKALPGSLAKAAGWGDVMPLVEALLKEGGSLLAAVRKAARKLPPGMGYGHVWLHPATREVWVSVGDWEEDLSVWRKPLEAVPGVRKVRIEAEGSPPEDEPWVLVKRGTSPVVQHLGQLAGYVPGPPTDWMGGPTPLAALLAGGLLGASTGYLGGRLGEAVLPDRHFEEGKLRRNMALLGLVAGAGPAAWWASLSSRHGPTPGAGAWLSHWPHGQYSDTGLKKACDRLIAAGPPAAPLFKQALGAVGSDYGLLSLDQVPLIPRGPFARTVWEDPLTPEPVRAATTGLVDAASSLRGGSPFVSPSDVARVAVGMGSGYVSGLLVGKTLGALAGLRPEAQRALQRAGTWAGLLGNVIPLAFGR